MIASLLPSLFRVTLFWYLIGVFVLFIGPPRWIGERYEKLMELFPVPVLETSNLIGAANVQWHVLMYWTALLLVIWAVSLIVGASACEIRFRWQQYTQKRKLRPSGSFKGVTIATYSLGAIPQATVPRPIARPVQILSKYTPRRLFSSKNAVQVVVTGKVREVLGWLTPEEIALCQEIVGVLLTSPAHYAGAGHGVGLLEHTLNVLQEAAHNCTKEFRLPIIAALAHDVGKLLTFRPTDQGGWKRVGLHSREGARILATLPAFNLLSLEEQRALLLAVKYDHAPSKIPVLSGERSAGLLALRIINALSVADKAATAAEKNRNIEKIQPEDILWQDFKDSLRDAPVAQRGKASVLNQINNPTGSPYLYVYEITWREAALKRLPEEVAAALDLNRRDSKQVAKYTRILATRLRKEGLLLEELTGEDGTIQSISEDNPLWDIKSGTGAKAVTFKGVLVLQADPLWQKLNYKLGKFSPYPVTIIAPNAEVKPKDKSKFTFDPKSYSDFGLFESKPEETVETAAQEQATKDATLESADSSLAETTSSSTIKPLDAAEPKEGSSPLLGGSDVYAYLNQSATPQVAEGETKVFIESHDSEGTHKESKETTAPPKTEEPKKARRSKKAVNVNEFNSLGISRAEASLGIALADEEVVEKFPHLAIGQKYYTEDSPAVLKLGVDAGTPYPDNRPVQATEPPKAVSNDTENAANQPAIPQKPEASASISAATKTSLQKTKQPQPKLEKPQVNKKKTLLKKLTSPTPDSTSLGVVGLDSPETKPKKPRRKPF